MANDYLKLMQSDKPYITQFFDSPFELHAKAEKLLRAIDNAAGNPCKVIREITEQDRLEMKQI